MEIIEKTNTICSSCRSIITADLVRENNNIYMIKKCNKDGEEKLLYWKNYELYKAINGIACKGEICNFLKCAEGKRCLNHLKKTTQIMIDVTNNCNYNCPFCFASVKNNNLDEPSIEKIINSLPQNKKGTKLPHVCLIGGEPTLRNDLPEIIKKIIEKGYLIRLVTNGHRLLDENYILQLKEAGLKWIILQFDGFSDKIYLKLRGKELSKTKQDIINKLTKHNFKIQLAIMTVKGINIQETGEIIDFAFKQKNIFWINFYPNTSINRFIKEVEDTHTIDILKELEKTTQGKIKIRDFLTTMKFWSFLHRITRNKVFKQKLSTIPIILVSDKLSYYPINRFLNPYFVITHFTIFIKLIFSINKILNFEKLKVPSNILFLVIEKFHSERTIDLKEASNCHMSFMTNMGFIPFDIYNIVYKNEEKKCLQ